MHTRSCLYPTSYPCAGVACNSPPACRAGPGTCAVVGGLAACSYPVLLPGGTACEGTAGKQCSEAGVCKLPDANPGCVNTAAGLRQLTGTGSTPIYATPCATQPTGASVTTCEAFNYTGIKAWNACADGLCWRKVSSLGAGGTTGWVRESSGIQMMSAAACNPTPACTAFPDPPTNCAAPAPVDLSFFVIGDWGWQGSNNQTQVANLMGSRVQGRSPSFVLSTGENFYRRGLSSTADPLFDSSFINVYTQADLQGVPWHAVLGNHDYNEGTFCAMCGLSPNHQLGTGPGTLNARDARWHAYRNTSLLLAGGQVEIFLIDTPPFHVAYKDQPWATYPGGILQQSWQQQYCSLKARLVASCAPWKLAVGHHPTRSNGNGHGNTAELITWLEPLFFATACRPCLPATTTRPRADTGGGTVGRAAVPLRRQRRRVCLRARVQGYHRVALPEALLRLCVGPPGRAADDP